MGELKTALDTGKKIRVFPGLDPEWDKMYEKLAQNPTNGDLFARLRGEYTLFDLVGARAVGKTFWSDFLLKHFGIRLGRVKNTTTRAPRNKEDHKSYRFVTETEFKKGVKEHQFLEWDKYQGHYYGSSLQEIRKVLKNRHGIFAITPRGAIALNSHRLEINLCTIFLMPKSDKVLLQNFARRGITDPKKRSELLKDAENFNLPSEVPHQKVIITGNTEEDKKNILKIVESLIMK
jgi:guanylate kinase